MCKNSRKEYLFSIKKRYNCSSKLEKKIILDEFCETRAYHKNDNAHIEGKNWTLIRQYLGYERFDNPGMVKLLNELYTAEWYYFVNFFLPSSKLVNKF